jgi:cytochrome c553
MKRELGVAERDRRRLTASTLVAMVIAVPPMAGWAAQRDAGAQTAAQAPAPPPAAAAQTVDPAPTGDRVKGKETFAKVGCYQCHGREAQGSPTTGPRLGPNPMPFRAFAQYVRTPRGQMPPYTSIILPDQDLADMYAFVRAQPPAAKVDRTLLP